MGKPYEHAFYPNSGLFHGRKPTDIRKLDTGNELAEFRLHIYRDYFNYRAVDRGACVIFVEINPKNIVVSVSSEGVGCYMPY